MSSYVDRRLTPDCAAGCKSCAGSSDHCTKCNPGVAHEGKCVSTCPEGTQEADGQCAPCHPDCATCSAPGAADKCTTCPSSRPVYQSGRCVNYCPPKTYFHSTDSVAEGSNVNGTACGRCDDSCASCISLNGCTTCPDNHVLVGGKCQPANCTGPFATSLGTCLSSVVDLKFREPPTPMLSAENGSQSKPNDAKKYYPLASLAIIPIVILILAFLYVRRERRKTRDATAEFGRQLDEVEINKCIQRLNDDQDDYIPMATVRHAREDYKKKHSGDLASPRGVDEAVPPPYTPSAIDVAVDKKSPVAKSEHAFGGRPLIPSRQSVATTQQPNTASTPQQNAENIWAELYFSKPANTGRQGGDGLV